MQRARTRSMRRTAPLPYIPATCSRGRITVPAMTEEELGLNLPFEFRDYIADDKDKYSFDYAVLGMQRDAAGNPVENGYPRGPRLPPRPSRRTAPCCVGRASSSRWPLRTSWPMRTSSLPSKKRQPPASMPAAGATLPNGADTPVLDAAGGSAAAGIAASGSASALPNGGDGRLRCLLHRSDYCFLDVGYDSTTGVSVPARQVRGRTHR